MFRDILRHFGTFFKGGWIMEKLDDGSIIFENDIDRLIFDYCQKYDFESPKTMTQNQWSGALIYIYNHLFKNTDILKDKSINIYNNNNIPGLDKSNCGRYNIDLLNVLCDYYCYLCTVYDKEISVMGFYRLTGVHWDTIEGWRDGKSQLNTAASTIWEKLHKGREESLVSKLVSNKNPVAIIAILNKHFGYNMPGVRDQSRNNAALTAESLPQLGTIQDIVVNDSENTRE
jgi:hypothetical protein